MMADVPENYDGQPELEFLERVPTTWDDTKALNGQIGDYITVARRSGRDWFVGSMTDEQPETLAIPLRFLEPRTPYVANIYGDAPTTDLETNPNQVQITRLIASSGDTLVAPLAGAGGQAVQLTPATPGPNRQSVLRQPAHRTQSRNTPLPADDPGAEIGGARRGRRLACPQPLVTPRPVTGRGRSV
jgi:alpha-glucosidase